MMDGTEHFSGVEISGILALVGILGGLLWWSIRQMVSANGEKMVALARKIDMLADDTDGIPPLKEQIGYLNGQMKEMHDRIEKVADRYHTLGNSVMHRTEIEAKILDAERRSMANTTASEERLNNRFDRLEDKIDAIMDKVK